MTKVSAGATMSLDGFIAGPHDSGFDMLFKWYGAGDVEVPMPDTTAGVPAPHVSAASAELLRHEQEGWGALVVGRGARAGDSRGTPRPPRLSPPAAGAPATVDRMPPPAAAIS